jgi:hypothetical protein
VTTPAQDRHIRLRHLLDRFTTATSTAAAIPGQRSISDQAIRNCLREAGIRARRPVKAVVLTRRHRQVRLQWVQTHRVWPQQRWRTVWFSDESRFLLKRGDGRGRVYRRRNERFVNNCIQEVDRFGGGSVMMWAAISHTGKTALVHIPGNLTAQRYCDEILQPHVLPLMQQNNARFQHENARPNTARISTAILTNSSVAVLP